MFQKYLWETIKCWNIFAWNNIIKKDQGLNQIVYLITTSLLFSKLRELQLKNCSFDYKYRKSEIV